MYTCMPEENIDCIIDGCKIPCGCRELNSELPEEKLLTAEPSLSLSYLSSPHLMEVDVEF